MNIKNNKNLRVRFMSMATVLFMGLMGCFLASCDDELDIQQSYPFTVETMPVPNNENGQWHYVPAQRPLSARK